MTGEHDLADSRSDLGSSIYGSMYRETDGAPTMGATKRGSESITGRTDSPNGTDSFKQKSTRGARACTNCHRLKMKCEGAEDGRPCQRCARSGHECVFLESHRGRKSEKRRKTAAMQQAFKKMENVLFSVIQNMQDNGSSLGELSGTSTATQSPMIRGQDDRARNASPGKSDGQYSTSPDPEQFVSRLQHMVSKEGGAENSRSAQHLAEAAIGIMQHMGVMDETARERLINSKDDTLLKQLLQNAIHKNPSRPSLSTSQNFDETDSARTNCLPDNTLNPLGLLAEASLQNWQRQRSNDKSPSVGRAEQEEASPADLTPSSAQSGPSGSSAMRREGSSSSRAEKQFGLANETYFHSIMKDNTSRPPVENESVHPPELLTDGVINSEEALELFRIFFHHCSLHMFLLDPEWHTPTLVCSRSPFLFTCVCSVASKFYTQRPELYVQCLRKAIKMAFEVMSRGSKSPEIVQGFLLLTLYNQPAERYEEDRTWLFAGVAIRMAQDLNLHRKCSLPAGGDASEEKVREILNRERTWYICFCVDRTLSAQMGKPYSIREDWIIRHAADWCTQKYSRPWDLGICALVDLLRVQTRQLDFLYSSTVTPSGLNLDMDYPAILPSFNEQLNETMQFWYRLGLDSMTRHWDPIMMNRGNEASGHQTPSSAMGASSMAKNATKDNSQSSSSAHAQNSNSIPADGAQPDRSSIDRENLSLFGTMPRELMNMDGTGLAEKIRVSTLLALHESEPPGDDADMNIRSMYYIARQAPLRYNYAILVLNSFGLQYALERPSDGASVDKPLYLVRCVHAAKEIIATVKYGMREILRYAPDPTFVVVAYACVFLLKLIRPTFANYINEEEVIALINYTIEVLEEAAVDPTHTPALYASFLRSLVQSRPAAPSQADTEARSDGQGRSSHETSHAHASTSEHNTQPNAAGHEARLDRVREMMNARSTDPSTANELFGRAEMTVNPTQVNPIAASLATSDLHPRPNSDLGELHAGAMRSGMPLGMDTYPEQTPHTSKPSEESILPSDGLSSMLGWDAIQYAKAQGVDVNRVLDNSFWSSLLPTGYGGGASINNVSAESSRDADLFRMQPSFNTNWRTSLTPGATRASSPTFGLSSAFPL
ncbi:hypothetical protein MPSI1_000734 [Malassezia psittaci]|uniref:Zn(2)-C6 fungal-type domain-containing protein n=1 Tax=Malassezia psittaci TaxID=1821823 RepID=A0AAF0F382_9BASI|nr:hypothetical protein MPSI1_000734 [Malassezia psittaci]